MALEWKIMSYIYLQKIKTWAYESLRKNFWLAHRENVFSDSRKEGKKTSDHEVFTYCFFLLKIICFWQRRDWEYSLRTKKCLIIVPRDDRSQNYLSLCRQERNYFLGGIHTKTILDWITTRKRERERELINHKLEWAKKSGFIG